MSSPTFRHSSSEPGAVRGPTQLPHYQNRGLKLSTLRGALRVPLQLVSDRKTVEGTAAQLYPIGWASSKIVTRASEVPATHITRIRAGETEELALSIATGSNASGAHNPFGLRPDATSNYITTKQRSHRGIATQAAILRELPKERPEPRPELRPSTNRMGAVAHLADRR